MRTPPLQVSETNCNKTSTKPFAPPPISSTHSHKAETPCAPSKVSDISTDELALDFRPPAKRLTRHSTRSPRKRGGPSKSGCATPMYSLQLSLAFRLIASLLSSSYRHLTAYSHSSMIIHSYSRIKQSDISAVPTKLIVLNH